MFKKTYDHEMGQCESCGVKIADQDKYQTAADDEWIVFCEKHAATYQEILDQWNEGGLYSPSNVPEPFNNWEEFVRARNSLAARDNLAAKPLAGPETPQ